MADEEHADGGMTVVASRVAAICDMIDELETARTAMSARRIAAITAMINQVAAEAEGRNGRWTRKRLMGNASAYKKVRTLGKGSSGVVDKAVHRATGQLVSLKSPGKRPRVGRDSALRELLREACFMAACRGSPSVVALRGVARVPGTRYYSLVMECVEGLTLERVLKIERRGQQFPEAQVRSVVRQLLAGAEVMHRHRDISPANIFVVRQEDDIVVKIGDYGTAFSTAEREKQVHSGTVKYMSPEMLLEKAVCDTAVDLWSIGCVMAELLAGTALFQGDDEADLRHQIFDLLGVPGKKTAKAFKTPLAGEVQQWRRAQQKHKHKNRLRERFPEELLSAEGFEVLNGLLTCNPSKRLDATAALNLAWFAPVAPVREAAGAPTPETWSLLSFFGRALGFLRPTALFK